MSTSTVATLVLATGLVCGCADPNVSQPLSPMPRTELKDCDTTTFDTAPILIQGDRPDIWRNAEDVSEATVKFVVTPSGTTDQISAETTSDWRLAGFAGLAVRDWKFEPARKAGIPVLTHCKVTMRYEVR